MFPYCKALFLEGRREAAEALFEALSPDVSFLDHLVAASPTEALSLLIEQPLEICFLSERYPADVLDAFVSDAKRVEGNGEAVFVLVVDEAADQGKRTDFRKRGITASISRSITPSDKGTLAELAGRLQTATNARVREEARREIDRSIPAIVTLIDEAALERKFGPGRRCGSVRAELLASLAGQHETLMEQFVESLVKKLPEHPPEGFAGLDVPEETLKAGLPYLSKDAYSGFSRRVRTKLTVKMGKKGP